MTMQNVVSIRQFRNSGVRGSAASVLINETSGEVNTANFVSAFVTIDVQTLTTPNVADTVDFYVQTKVNGKWCDVSNVHFVNADNGTTPYRIVKIGPMATGVASFTPTDGTLGNNTSVSIPLGEAVRIKVKVAGPTAAFNYIASISVFGQ